MKRFGWGVVATVVVLAIVFLLGRASVPDRSEQLLIWRKSADSTLQASRAKADSARVQDSVRIAEAEARWEREHQRMVTAVARTDQQIAATDSLKQLLVVVQASADSAGIIRLQAGIITRLEGTIQDLRADFLDAQVAMAGLREDRRRADSTVAARDTTIIDLHATIAAGLEATKPSRGRSLGAFDCTLGPTTTRHGLDWVGVSCGASLRTLLGKRAPVVPIPSPVGGVS